MNKVDEAFSEVVFLQTQILIIGGGPAGLAACNRFINTGVSVVLVDENAELGGQYYRQRSDHIRRTAGEFRRHGRELVKAVRNSEIRVVTSSYIFAVDDGDKVFYAFNEKTNSVVKILCEFVIVATGSHELVLPYRGWETPRCITPGMASRLFDIDYISSRQSIVIGGGGPFLLSVAAHLLERGVNVKAVIEYHNPYVFRIAAMLVLLFPTRLVEFLRYRWILWSNKVPIHSGYQVKSAEPMEHGIRSKFVPVSSGSELEFQSDFLAISYGFLPTIELASTLDVSLEQTVRGCRTITTVSGRSSRDWIYVVGESVSIQGWRSALLRGQLAALEILSKLQGTSIYHWAPFFGKTLGVLWETLFTYMRKIVFQEDMPLRIIADDETLVCRCECVTYHEIGQYLDQVWSTASGLKAETRVGMGTCQGKQCGYALSQICASLGLKVADSFINVRIPLRPVPISALMQLPDNSDLACCS